MSKYVLNYPPDLNKKEHRVPLTEEHLNKVGSISVRMEENFKGTDDRSK